MNLSPDSTYVEDVEQVMDIDQWFRAIAVNDLIDNNEYSLMNGDPTGDDYIMYRGVVDTRFRLSPVRLGYARLATPRGVSFAPRTCRHSIA